MTTASEYAQLALFVYQTRDQGNRIDLPMGWELAEPLHPDNGFGFAYGIFRRTGTNEIVVSFAGTNSGLDIDWLSNFSNGVGLSSAQTTEAALSA